MDKTEVIRLIKEWIKADTEINEIKKIEKSKKHARQELSEQLSSLMKTNNVDCFDVADGQIVYNSRTTKKTHNKKVPNYFVKQILQGGRRTGGRVK
jgi:hypothetical protein